MALAGSCVSEGTVLTVRTNVLPGLVSLTENIMMVVMAVRMSEWFHDLSSLPCSDRYVDGAYVWPDVLEHACDRSLALQSDPDLDSLRHGYRDGGGDDWMHVGHVKRKWQAGSDHRGFHRNPDQSRAHIRDPRVRKLAARVIEAQVREIGEMKQLIADMDTSLSPEQAQDLLPVSAEPHHLDPG